MSSRPGSKKELFSQVESPEILHRDPTVVIKGCALCGERNAKRLYMQAHFPVVRCRGCGLVYADEHFRDEDLAAFYSGDYYQRAYVCHPPAIDEKIAGDYERAFRRIDRVLGGGRVLDFGSARGTFLGRLRDQGFEDRWQLEGVDINPDEVAMGRDVGLDVRCGTVEAPAYADETYDAITAFSVIEHLQDPLAILRELARVLRPGGRLLLIVPSGRCLIISLALMANKLLGDRVRNFTDNVFHEEHLYYFTVRTMKRALEETGFAAREWFHEPSYLETHPPGLLLKLPATGLRFLSWATRRQTMLGVVAERL